ncbi:class I adenylate-forming enzyme family protein [Mesorhizobium sp. KR9-304]|uniref:class I adenylate-forming enzyme family protein n=1 Tax=Mesorhizobium sp. KR9-304 TaxID=3156614 RepID=UPI0032B437F9
MTKASVAALLPAIVAALPETAQLIDVRSGKRHSRDAIWQTVCERAVALAASGIERGDTVVVGQSDGAEFILDVFAAWTAGAVAVAVNPRLTPDEQRRVLASTGARLWLGPVACETPLRLVEDKPADLGVLASRALGLDVPALMLMTSGTTGTPKGVVHSLRSLSARLALNIDAIGLPDLARTLNVLPAFFGHGLIGNCLTALAGGGALHVWTGPDVAELRDLADFIDREKITFMSSVPSFWKIAMRMSEGPKHPLARVHVGSAPLSLELWTEIGRWAGTKRVFNMYGMTETANWIGGASLEDPAAGDGLVGRAWGGSFGVLGEDGEVRQRGSGEVVLNSPSIMLGFHGMANKTSEVFHGSWFRTGDIGEIDADGRLFLVGRIKNEINRGGIKVPAEEIDMLLERHPDIAEACAFGLADPVSGEAVAVAIVMREGAQASDEAIKEWCRKHIRAEAAPSRIFRLAEIPRNERGKIVRSVVRETALSLRAAAE